ncbi:Diaminopimelate epimerase-like protein [Delitschia confertaspora ATCC 74209]|uniref:Diaminopimelate epimerase-like protein n=1 Tax=Delitschia confertaspora ATCC 74209 TaxID=1513339 RepID=A0A9P4JLM3_9PLEO|nr:Diaminopimelate epimerase-like protein [Delitschia confertaspora ATCC 74209]
MSTQPLDFVTVDVFTKERYAGNPLAIVKVPASSKLTQDQKQAIAREFNLSETTFLHERQDGGDLCWTVDIFVTNAELPFAGHPTIGTACHALSEHAKTISQGEDVIHAKFKVKAGTIGLEYHINSNITKASIPHNLHIHPQTYHQDRLFKHQPGLAHCIGENSTELKTQEFPIVSIVKGMTFVLIELDDGEQIESITTNAKPLSLKGLDEEWHPKDAFVGSYFYYRLKDAEDGAKRVRTRMIEGTLEDPATGSAASDLAGYLALQEGKPGQTMKFEITQGLEMGRKSDIGVEVVLGDDGNIREVYLIGSAVGVMEGRVTV